MAKIERYDDSTEYVDDVTLITQDAEGQDDVVFVRFDGDSKPRGARGEQSYNVWSYEAIFPKSRGSDAKDLYDLLRTDDSASDDRLVVETDAPWDDEVVIQASGVRVNRQPGGVISITWTGTEVEG